MKFGFVFPGQGSQHVGMLAEFADQYPIVFQTFNQASEILGFDLWEIAANGPQEKLNQTDLTQPALLATSVAIWRIWQAQKAPQPALFAGHSLGEYSALVCAGALQFTDAIAVVHQRGQFMQAAVPMGTGLMAAIIGLADHDVIEVCKQASTISEIVSAANFNSPAQIVIAGHTAAVQRACELAKQKGAKRALVLAVSVPSHCALMQSAAEKLRPILEAINIAAPHIPVINNVDVNITSDPAQIREALIAQLTQPVRWVEIIQKMHQDGCIAIGECGAGKVLTGLNKRIVENVTCFSMNDPESLEQVIECVKSN
ncbi:MAG: [acyl-carrier-protein] S-malonyltransferase [Gammaproteobacteria bacterium]|nr:[acyl-carrier-protein] S-malonyltransferase [Gammaproteobacteria bacterium]